MSHYHINVFYSDEDRAYVSDIPDLPGCSALGDTAEEAVAEKSNRRRKRGWRLGQSPEPRYKPAARA